MLIFKSLYFLLLLMTKKINRDHAKKQHHPLMENDAIVLHLSELLTPSIFAQEGLFRDLGMRNRILNLSLMTAAILTLLWRNVPSVNELTRILNREGFLWVNPTTVSQKALSERFLTFPSILFEQVFKELLPKLKQRWQDRTNRPLPDSVCFSLNGIKLQIWGTWLFYGVLIDLGDAVAEELSLPFDSISIKMIYRGLYHFIVAYNKGKAKDIIKYFSAPENRDLGIIKRRRKPRQKLIIAPFPKDGKNRFNFFFENPLTPCF